VIAKYLPLLAASLRRKRLRTFFTLASIVVASCCSGSPSRCATRCSRASTSRVPTG